MVVITATHATYSRLIDLLSANVTQMNLKNGEAINLELQDRSQLTSFIRETDASEIDHKFLERFERVTHRKPHRFLRRGIVFSHRDLDLILDKYEQGHPIYLFTGRGPSSGSLHLGHSIPFEFTRWLQDVFNAKLIIMLTDDMKLLHDTKLTFEDVRQFDIANGKDILAFGYDVERTFVFSNIDFVGGAFYKNIVLLARHISVDSIKSALGFNDANNVGMFYCCSTQSAGCFPSSFPGILGTTPFELNSMSCLISCSYDIDGYFAEVRRHASSLGQIRPAFLYSSLLPSLQGDDKKMSASVAESSIFLTDSEFEVREKLTTAFPAGGMNTKIAFEWLRFFMEDDEELQQLQMKQNQHQLLNIELREVLIQTVLLQLFKFQDNRLRVTDQILKEFMTPRLLAS